MPLNSEEYCARWSVIIKWNGNEQIYLQNSDCGLDTAILYHNSYGENNFCSDSRYLIKIKVFIHSQWLVEIYLSIYTRNDYGEDTWWYTWLFCLKYQLIYLHRDTSSWSPSSVVQTRIQAMNFNLERPKFILVKYNCSIPLIAMLNELHIGLLRSFTYSNFN